MATALYSTPNTAVNYDLSFSLSLSLSLGTGHGVEPGRQDKSLAEEKLLGVN